MGTKKGQNKREKDKEHMSSVSSRPYRMQCKQTRKRDRWGDETMNDVSNHS